ncbi:hypothetical protein M422DRAFT_69225 [Sphaerobolus stellatus SS14]|uniref:Uncharacterized protein n=1 Tax=Sphaerobolus stellatus (strain SS14) TaxID=990650 RepID=A0A0C9USD7_SPHS4|nr:hypothetical protein M422DRAFT_69225 [Sphaerobolus stellatus SS14]
MPHIAFTLPSTDRSLYSYQGLDGDRKEAESYQKDVERKRKEAENCHKTAKKLQREAEHLRREATNLYEEAERLHKEVFRISLRDLGPDSVYTGFSHNILGEVQCRLAKYEEAEEHLLKAIAIRVHCGYSWDSAISRENLAQVYEGQGRFLEAKGIRDQGSPDSMVCGNSQCSGKLYNTSQLKQCNRCHVSVVISLMRFNFDVPRVQTISTISRLWKLIILYDNLTEDRLEEPT